MWINKSRKEKNPKERREESTRTVIDRERKTQRYEQTNQQAYQNNSKEKKNFPKKNFFENYFFFDSFGERKEFQCLVIIDDI